jgi:hypothetical protein
MSITWPAGKKREIIEWMQKKQTGDQMRERPGVKWMEGE